MFRRWGVILRESQIQKSTLQALVLVLYSCGLEIHVADYGQDINWLYLRIKT
jgi:hypothetical protein